MELVLMMSEPEDRVFDQSCAYGCRVVNHAVYCTSENPDSPRKCRRTWATNGEVKDEDCKFYEQNSRTPLDLNNI